MLENLNKQFLSQPLQLMILYTVSILPRMKEEISQAPSGLLYRRRLSQSTYTIRMQKSRMRRRRFFLALEPTLSPLNSWTLTPVTMLTKRYPTSEVKSMSTTTRIDLESQSFQESLGILCQAQESIMSRKESMSL